MFFIASLLFLLFDFGNCSLYNITVLHLGESDDIYINDAVAKAVNFINKNEEYEVLVDLISYHFNSREDVKTVCARITEDVVPDLILDTTRKKHHVIVAERIVVSYGLPTISTSYIERIDKNEDLMKKYDPDEMYLLKVRTPRSEFCDVIKDIAHLQGMTNVAVIFQPEFVGCKSLRFHLSSQGIPSIFFEYKPNYAKKLVKAVTTTYFVNVFLLGNITIGRENWGRNLVIYSILSSESDVDHQADVYTWPSVKSVAREKLVIGYGGVPIDNAFYFDLTLTGILSAKYLIANNKPEYQDSICDNADPYPSRKDLNFRQYIVQEIPFSVHIITQDDQPIFGEIHMKKNNESFMEFDFAIVKNDSKGYSPLGTYKVRFNNSLEVPKGAPWIKPIRHYKVLALVKPPFVYYNYTTNKAYGYNIDLLDSIALILGFTYELSIIKVNRSDFYTNNSDGFIDEMVARNVDIGLGPIFPSVMYKNKVDTSIPYYKPIGIKFVMKRSKDDSIFTFITVLETIVWVCILTGFFLNSFILWCAEHFSPYSYKNDKERYKDVDVEDTRDFTVKECLWFSLTSMTPQGGGNIPQHLSGRLVVVTWWLFGFIILASYTANLSAFLTLSKMKNPIASFTDLYRQFRMHYAPLMGSDVEAYFMNMAQSEKRMHRLLKSDEYPLPNKYARMKQIILNSTLPYTVEEALERVYESKSATDGFAFLVDSMDAKYLLMTRCNLIDVDEEVGKRPLVIAVPKNTLLKFDIDKALTMIMQRREDEALEKKWWDDNPYRALNCVELEDESEGIGVYNIGGVFLIIFIGIGITSMTISYDYWRYIRRQKVKITPVTPLPRDKTLNEDTSLEDVEMPKKNEEVENFSQLQHRKVTRY